MQPGITRPARSGKTNRRAYRAPQQVRAWLQTLLASANFNAAVGEREVAQ